MKKGKRIVSVLLSSLLLTAALSACGTSKEGDASSPSGTNGTSPAAGADGKKITLSVQTPYADETNANLKTLRKLIADYTAEHPNVSFTVDALPTEQQKLKLKTQAASNAIPDITSLNPGAQMKPFVDNGKLAPLDDILDKDGLRDTFKPGVLDYYTFDGKTYGLPETLDIAYIYYNKELFQKAGVEVPQTFEQLVADVDKFKQAGIVPITIGEKDTWPGSFFLMNIVLRQYGPGFLQDVLAKKKPFTDPAFVQSISKLGELVKAGGFEEGATNVDYSTAMNLFLTGKAAMYFSASWDQGSVETSEIRDKVGIFPFPTVGGKGDIGEFMLSPGNSYVVSANSKHMAEAKDFLHYYMTNFPKVMFEFKGGVGLAQNVEGDFQAAGYSKTAIELLKMFTTVKGGDLAFDNTMDPTTTQVHLNSVQNLFVSDENPQDVAQEHQNEFEANNP